MTAQISDILKYRGRDLKLCDDLLRPYLMRIRKSRRPVFAPKSTANWRGYLATWEIDDGELYLASLEGRMRKDDEVIDGSVETAFPWVKGKLLAKWFSGEIRCPEGRLLTYVHHGYCSTYERDRFLRFEKGRLTEEFLVLNPPNPITYKISHEGVRTCINSMHYDDYRTIADPLEGEDVKNAHLAWGQPPGGPEENDE